MTEQSRLARWRGLVGLAVRRVITRATETERRQTALSVLGIAVSVALVLFVTSVALGLATGSLADDGVDYWIVPEGGASSAVTPVEGQKLGGVHRATERIERLDGVTSATPVLISLVRANTTTGSGTEYLLAVGAIPSERGSVVGLSTAPLTPGDPYYAAGGYDGTRTGELVLSNGGSEVLGASVGDRVSLAGGARASNRSFRVVATEEGVTGGLGQLPMFVVHLSELQAVTGAAETDSADRILVRADDPNEQLEQSLERIYPQTDVLTPGERMQKQALSSRLPLAIAVASLIVAVVVGALFLVTTLGFELASDAANRQVMAAVGFSQSSLGLLVAVQTLAVSVVGGLLGILLWGLSLVGVNAVTDMVYGASVARFHPLLPVYGLAVTLCIGLLAVPYLVVVGWRTTSDPGRVGT